MQKNDQQHDSSTSLTTAPPNADQLQGSTQGPLCDEKQVPASEPAEVKRVVEPTSRRSAGPRTPKGKQFNAIKHGILARGLVLPNESRAEFESLRNGLWEDLKPQGTMEEEVLTDLVMNRWNKRRLLRAKNAEIAESVEFLEFDRSMAQQAKAWDSEQWGCSFGGALKPSSNHFVLRKGIEILKHLRRSVETRGFSVEYDSRLLKTLYGVNGDGT